MITAGYESGPATPMTDADWQELNARIDQRVAKLESGESTAIPVEEAWPKITGKPWRAQSTDG